MKLSGKFNAMNNDKFNSLNEKEEKFLLYFEELLIKNNLKKRCSFNFLSNGILNVVYASIGQIGRLKLRGKVFKMQIIISEDDLEWIEGSEDYLYSQIPRWIRYIKYCIAEKNKRKNVFEELANLTEEDLKLKNNRKRKNAKKEFENFFKVIFKLLKMLFK